VGRGHVGSIGSVGCALARSGAREFHHLGWAHIASIGRARARMGRLVRLVWSVRGLADTGDEPISPSPRVMNSMCVCVYIYSVYLFYTYAKHRCTLNMDPPNGTGRTNPTRAHYIIPTPPH
jgi:hypothetical protein